LRSRKKRAASNYAPHCLWLSFSAAANRDPDAHAVLAPAIESFPPTQEFPELAEAQTLLATLSR
jgi:hypothetical protein